MKILIAEDDVLSRRTAQALLRTWGYEVVACADGAEAWRELHAEEPPRLALLDWIMPEMDGISVVRQLRREQGASYIYVILVTGRGAREDIVLGLEAGGDDYMVKPLHAAELRARIHVGIRILHLHDQLLAAYRASEFDATHDALTGLHNRRSAYEFLSAELARSARTEKPLAVLMLDVDHFKKVNDTYGHPAGDAVLQAIARRVTASVRKYDLVARFGGEEFLVVAPECNLEEGLVMAERVRLAVADTPIDVPDHRLKVSLTVGVAGGVNPELNRLLHSADAALYQAKAAGRNRLACAPTLFAAGTAEIPDEVRKPL